MLDFIQDQLIIERFISQHRTDADGLRFKIQVNSQITTLLEFSIFLFMY